MKIVTIKCDRCGNTTKPGGLTVDNMIHIRTSWNDQSHDLCPMCWDIVREALNHALCIDSSSGIIGAEL